MRTSRFTKEALELQVQRTVIRSTAITKILKYFSYSGATVVIFYFIYRSIESLAGSQTDANIDVVFDILKNRSVAARVPWALALGGIGYGLLERLIRIRKVARLTERNKYLEGALNERRQSSNLTETGSARREDK